MAAPTQHIETLPNPAPDRDYLIELSCPEFSCLCPRTSQPDFATLHFTYVPGPLIVELKSLKLYLWSFRQEGHFHEAVVNHICDVLVKKLSPKYLKIKGDFNIRGGIHAVITATSGQLPAELIA